MKSKTIQATIKDPKKTDYVKRLEEYIYKERQKERGR